MADWRDVMYARSAADSVLSDVDGYGAAIEEGGREGDPALATLLAAHAICKELRALGTLIDHARGDAR